MRLSPIRISESYRIPEQQRAAFEQSKTRFGAAQVLPDEMGGYFDFRDFLGNPVDQAYFLGRWTMLYFGYARCAGSCREAAPMLANAASTLRNLGYSARAAFVDIEVHPVSGPQPIARDQSQHRHAYNWPMRFAQSELFGKFAGRLDVLSGSRIQLTQATAAYHVLREHTVPHRGEGNVSINHSSMVYLIGPDTFVAAYGYHDIGTGTLVSLVQQLSDSERQPIDYSAAKRRYVRGACGGDIPA